MQHKYCVLMLVFINHSLSLLSSAGGHNHYTTQGLWVILGLLVFLMLEKMFPDQDNQEEAASHSDLNFNCAVSTEKSVGLISSDNILVFHPM